MINSRTLILYIYIYIYICSERSHLWYGCNRVRWNWSKIQWLDSIIFFNFWTERIKLFLAVAKRDMVSNKMLVICEKRVGDHVVPFLKHIHIPRITDLPHVYVFITYIFTLKKKKKKRPRLDPGLFDGVVESLFC